ncbi:MAG: hypothetical protein KDH97_02020 [Calditrichaeota bacterium]|nr:hypothetical protein [Calditrichota bacterium]MCB0294234.1 hypothetical protein [Calditrichota bacterium]MCB0303725.1 hypothetical protein [Calditrichota bacterium]MCB0314395.1 hypothetical protein [Calditrichota bacterium]
MKVLALVSLLAIWIQPLYGGFDYPAYSARNAGLGNSYLAGGEIRDGFLLNPALSALSTGSYAALNYANLYGMSELQFANGIALLPYNRGSIGLAVQTLGSGIYRESQLTINTAKAFYNRHLSIGISLHYYHVTAEGYAQTASWGLDAGFRYRIQDRLYIAGTLSNINQPGLYGHAEEIPQIAEAGVAYVPLPEISAYLAVRKDSWHAPEISLGASCRIYEQLEILSGYSSASAMPSLGIVLDAFGVEASYAVQHHFDLGPTHYIGLAFHPRS